MPSGLQAVFFTESRAKFVAVVLGAVLGQTKGGEIGSAVAMGVLDDELGLMKSILAGETGRTGAVVAAGIGAAAVELILGTEVGVAIGTGIGALVGTRAGIEVAMEVAERMGLVSKAVVGIGAAVGAAVGIAMIKKIIEEYFDLRTAADEITGCAS